MAKSKRMTQQLREEILANVMKDFLPTKKVEPVKAKIAKFAERMRQKMLKQTLAEDPVYNTLDEIEAAAEAANAHITGLYNCKLTRGGGGGVNLYKNNHITIWPTSKNNWERIRLTYDGRDYDTAYGDRLEERVGVHCTKEIDWTEADFQKAKKLAGEYGECVNERGDYRRKVVDLLTTVRTTKQLLDMLPEFDKYIPDDEEVMHLPAVDKDEILKHLKK